MEKPDRDIRDLLERIRTSEARLRLGEAASGIATFELDVDAGSWNWSPQATFLFAGASGDQQALVRWEEAVFPDDLLKLRAAVEDTRQSGNFYVEFRVHHPDRSLHWIAGRGQLVRENSATLVRGAIYEITDRKALEARLLAFNETLEARVVQAREEARTLAACRT